MQEWNPETKEYTGREIEKEVTYVGKTKNMNFWPKEDVEKYGYQLNFIKFARHNYKCRIIPVMSPDD